MKMFLKYSYQEVMPGIFVNGEPSTRTKWIAQPVLATKVEAAEDRYAVMPDGELPDQAKQTRYYDGTLKWWPRIERLGFTVFFDEPALYAQLMLEAGHKHGEMKGALHMYEADEAKWRKIWIEVTQKTAKDAEKKFGKPISDYNR